MAKQITFIGREAIVKNITKQIKAKKKQRFMFIEADGGIGKSRLINEIYKTKVQGKRTKVFIDFDNLKNRISENLIYNIANELDHNLSKFFRPYLECEIEYRDMERMRTTFEQLNLKREKTIQIFSDCFNHYSSKNRIVIFFDTTDKLNVGEEPWMTLKTLITKLNNCFLVFAGRNAKTLGKDLGCDLGQDKLILERLKPLSKEESLLYIKEKQKQLHITVEPEVVKKIVVLAGGVPILIDLAVEWRSGGITLDWLGEYKDKDISKIDENKLKQFRNIFEKQLVAPMKNLRKPIDRLSVLMTRVYPVNKEIIKKILNENDAEYIKGNADNFVFIKILQEQQYYTLHDKMREMVKEYVLEEIASIDSRMDKYSQQMIEYAEENIEKALEEIKKSEGDLNTLEGENAFKKSRDINELEQRLWVLREHLINHNLHLDTNKGLEKFIKIFDIASKESKFAVRRRFVDIINEFQYEIPKAFSKEQIFNIRYYNARQLFDEGKYDKSGDLCVEILKQENIDDKLTVQTLMLYGNCFIRKAKVDISIPLFETAVKICERNNFPLLEIRSKNTLGWSHRLIGNLDLAKKYYQEARNLCMKEGVLGNSDVSYEYGLIMNNYAFVLSDDNENRKAAIDIATSAVEHWKILDNDIGLGAAYLVLGVAYYRSDHSKQALESFDNAMNIFGPLKLNDWIGQIYSWRGAQYHDMQNFDEAEKCISESIKICLPNIMAMNLNRLGRIYMNRQEWDEAREYILESLKRSKEIPDYIYWLGSIARLISIAAKKYESHRYEEFQDTVNEYINKYKIIDKNSLGIAYLSLAKLAFLQNNPQQVAQIVENLKKGIPLIIEHGSFARTDYKTRLDIIEEDFDRTDDQIIQEVGRKMVDFIAKKEKENINYTPVSEVMYKWSNWKGGKNLYEKH